MILDERFEAVQSYGGTPIPTTGAPLLLLFAVIAIVTIAIFIYKK
jgi:hypothetical protein